MSLGGVIPASIGVPFLLAGWAPVPVAVAWLTAYLVISGTAFAFLVRGARWIEGWWSTATGILFAMLPVTAHVYDPGTKSFWIAATACIVVVSFEVLSLPYLGEFEWRFGVVFMGMTLAVVGYLEGGLVNLLLVPVIVEIMRNADSIRAKKLWLEASFASAESATERAHQIARVDAMTGVLNRRGLVAEINRIAQTSDYSLLMVDADRFKAINDAHGHAAGDAVIRRMSKALAERLGQAWVLGRLGGDEFVAVAPTDTEVPDGIGEAIQCTVALYGSESSLLVGVSGGVVKSRPGADTDRLLSMAGFAMRVAKRDGGGLAAFDDQLADRFARMVEFTATELDPTSFLAVFQPIVDPSGHILGCEALCRWKRPDGTILTPDQFLPLLLESGRMGLLNETMLRRGVAFAARFRDLDDAPYVSVNIGSAHLTDQRLIPLISGLLTEYGVAPDQLMIEITENDLLGQDTAWQENAKRLLELGVKLAIDDFGSGYSNIDRLNQLPITHLKFDRTLTTSVTGPLGSVARGVVEFAMQTDIGIISEGIETVEELAAMEAIGVTIFQGYLFCRPSEANEVHEAIRAQRSAVPSSSTSSMAGSSMPTVRILTGLGSTSDEIPSLGA